MTILTSLLGTKAFGLMVYMWQAAEASPAATPGVNHFSPMAMIKSMGAVAIGVVIVLLDHVSLFDCDHGGALLDLYGRQEAVARVCAARCPGAEE